MENNLEIPKIKVYVKIDTNKVVKEINSSIFIRDSTGFIEIDEGIGDKYSHAQSQYLEKGLTDEKGRYNYKWDNSLVELTEEEKNNFFPPAKPVYDLSKIERTFHETEQPQVFVEDLATHYRISLSRQNTGKWETITFYRVKTLPKVQVEQLYLDRIAEMFVFANAPEFFMYQQLETSMTPLTDMLYQITEQIEQLKGGI